ncbi:hypothetical protein Tco_0432627 [Tanacetum coccineum]
MLSIKVRVNEEVELDEISDEDVELGSVYEVNHKKLHPRTPVQLRLIDLCCYDENFVMGIKLARKVLKRQLPSQEFAEKKHLEGWGVRRQVMYHLLQGEKRRREDQHEINCDCEDEDVEVELLDDNVDKEEYDAEVEKDQEENSSQAESDKEENEVEAITDKEDNDLKKLIKKIIILPACTKTATVSVRIYHIGDIGTILARIELGSLGNKALRLNDQRILERICELFWAERMSAKGEKIVGKSLVFIGQTGGAST